MVALAQPPFSLTVNQQVVVRVVAHNVRGWGAAGVSTNGVLVQTIPQAMLLPYRDTSTTNRQVVVNWAFLSGAAAGMSPITSYNLWWDQGTDGETWYSLIGMSEPIIGQSSFTATNGVLEGHYYKFKIRAMNIWGWGPFSPVATIKASTVPNTVSNIQATYDASNGNLEVSWNIPASNGDVVTSYAI